MAAADADRHQRRLDHVPERHVVVADDRDVGRTAENFIAVKSRRCILNGS
jgi:hypothetical protein